MKSTACVTLALLILLGERSARAETFRYVDRDGREHAVPIDAAATRRAAAAAPPPVFHDVLSVGAFASSDADDDAADFPYEPLVREAAAMCSLPVELIRAVMKVESGCHPGAISPVGRGRPDAAHAEHRHRARVTNAFDPRQNVRGGARLLRILVNTFQGDLELALAGVSRGSGRRPPRRRGAAHPGDEAVHLAACSQSSTACSRRASPCGVPRRDGFAPVRPQRKRRPRVSRRARSASSVVRSGAPRCYRGRSSRDRTGAMVIANFQPPPSPPRRRSVRVDGVRKVAFTQSVREHYGLSTEDVRRIQFFTAEDIVLQRELAAQAKSAQDNELIVLDGVRTEEVVIAAHTPGVAVRVEGEYILVSFSREHPERALWFGLHKGQDAAAALEGRVYRLAPLEIRPSSRTRSPSSRAWRRAFSSRGRATNIASSWAGTPASCTTWTRRSRQTVKQQPPGWRLSEGPRARGWRGRARA